MRTSLKSILFGALTALGSLSLLSGCAGSHPASAAAAKSPASPVAQNNTAPRADYVVHPLPPGPPSPDNLPDTVLAWDSKSKTYNAKAGEISAEFTFSLTNLFSGPIVIYDTATSCGCTVARLPHNPWVLPSGSNGLIHVSMDLRGKADDVTKEVTIFTSKGNSVLTVETLIPPQTQ